jgi:hypothetical protein
MPTEGVVDGRKVFDVEHRDGRRATGDRCAVRACEPAGRRTGCAWRDP